MRGSQIPAGRWQLLPSRCGGSRLLAQWFPFNFGTASARGFRAYRPCAASRETCLAKINQVALAGAALDSVLLTFLMTSVFWLGGQPGSAVSMSSPGRSPRSSPVDRGAGGAAPLRPSPGDAVQRWPKLKNCSSTGPGLWHWRSIAPWTRPAAHSGLGSAWGAVLGGPEPGFLSRPGRQIQLWRLCGRSSASSLAPGPLTCCGFLLYSS